MTKKIKLLMLLAFFSINTYATPVNINTANAQTIADSLTGIGLKKAQSIVKYREEKGPFKSFDDFSQVSGIGDKTIEKNKADILFADPSEPAPIDSTKPQSTKKSENSKTVEKRNNS